MGLFDYGKSSDSFVSETRQKFLNQIGIFRKEPGPYYNIQIGNDYFEWSLETNEIKKGSPVDFWWDDFGISDIVFKLPLKEVCPPQIIIKFSSFRKMEVKNNNSKKIKLLSEDKLGIKKKSKLRDKKNSEKKL